MFLSRHKMNSLALFHHTQLLEVLEIPQLMETCVRNGYYEEALELSSHVRRMEKKQTNIPIIKVYVMIMCPFTGSMCPFTDSICPFISSICPY